MIYDALAKRQENTLKGAQLIRQTLNAPRSMRSGTELLIRINQHDRGAEKPIVINGKEDLFSGFPGG